ncbi:DUF2231 domain-containing protein [Nocardioides sp.]|nr:DUF2231 domain-containing protein [Nocardioides sp.]
MESAKRPRSILAGPYAHPFHPILVTVPIGAWVASLVFDLASAAVSDKEAMFAEGAYWLIALGVVGALAAAIFGLLDLLTIPRGTRAFKVGLTHMSLNLFVVVLFVVGFLVRAAQGYEEFSGVGTLISIVALALLGLSGWLGGELAYRYGVRVASEETQQEGFR